MGNRAVTEFDVIVVGGGAIGGTLALQLAAGGYRVAVIEAALPLPGPSDPERVIALSHGSRCHLETAGLWPDVAQAGVGLIRHIDVREPGNSGRVTMDAADAAGAAPHIEALGYVIEMGQLIAPIHARLQEQVSLFCPARVCALQMFDTHVEVTFTEDSEERRLSAALLVGADGTYSQIRSLAGIGTRGWDYNRFGLVASVAMEKPHNDVAFECFRQAGPLAFLPMADGRYSIVWALEPGEAARLLSMPERMFIKKLERTAGAEVRAHIGRITAMGRRGSFPLELTIAERYARGRVALAGNAAHTTHPVAGQGMNLGLRDVAVMVQMLGSRQAHADPGAPILLQGYSEKRRLDVLAVAGFTEGMVTGFGLDFAPAQWLRAGAMNALERMPGLRGMLLKQASGIAQMQSLNRHGEQIE